MQDGGYESLNCSLSLIKLLTRSQIYEQYGVWSVGKIPRWEEFGLWQHLWICCVIWGSGARSSAEWSPRCLSWQLLSHTTLSSPVLNHHTRAVEFSGLWKNLYQAHALAEGIQHTAYFVSTKLSNVEDTKPAQSPPIRTNGDASKRPYSKHISI